jgi:hypothetical protein
MVDREATKIPLALLVAALFCGCNGGGSGSGSNTTNTGTTCNAVPLAMQRSEPASGAIDVARTSLFLLTFSTALNANTVTAASITLQSAAGQIGVALNVTGNTVTVIPSQRLLPQTEYSLSVTENLHGTCDEHLAGALAMSFTTERDQSNVAVQQIAPGGGAAQSMHYKMVATLGAPISSTASVSTHYRLQAGLTGADMVLR